MPEESALVFAAILGMLAGKLAQVRASRDGIADALQLFHIRLVGIEQRLHRREPPQDLVGLFLIVDQVFFQRFVGGVLHSLHLFAKNIAKVVGHAGQTLPNQGQRHCMALGCGHVHHAGRVQAFAFERPLLNLHERNRLKQPGMA